MINAPVQLNWEEITREDGYTFWQATDEYGFVYSVRPHYMGTGFEGSIRTPNGERYTNSGSRKLQARRGIKRTSYTGVGAPYKTVKPAKNWCEKEAGQIKTTRENFERMRENFERRNA